MSIIEKIKPVESKIKIMVQTAFWLSFREIIEI